LAVPTPIAEAIRLLEASPDDAILEIGCGRGVAARLICEAGGSVTGLDRSAGAIAAARARNAEFVAEGRARFLHAAIETADLGAARFDKVLAVRVNLFWRDHAAGLTAIRRVLAPGGRLYLVQDAPHGGPLTAMGERIGANLAAMGFGSEVLAGRPAGLLCMRAWV